MHHNQEKNYNIHETIPTMSLLLKSKLIRVLGGRNTSLFKYFFPFFLTKWVIYNFINQITCLRLSQTISFRLNCHTFFFFFLFHRTLKNVQDKFPLAVPTPNIIHMLFHVPFLHVYLFFFLSENLPY